MLENYFSKCKKRSGKLLFLTLLLIIHSELLSAVYLQPWLETFITKLFLRVVLIIKIMDLSPWIYPHDFAQF